MTRLLVLALVIATSTACSDPGPGTGDGGASGGDATTGGGGGAGAPQGGGGGTSGSAGLGGEGASPEGGGAGSHGGDPGGAGGTCSGGASSGAAGSAATGGSSGAAGSGGGNLNECETNNGGCHVLTTCTDLPQGRECGPCPPSYSGSGETGCVPNTCDGAPDADCACIKVAPDGDDTLASASFGLTAFRNFQPAVDFTHAHPELASKVCVAAGTSCGPVFTYTDATMQMRNGVSVYGNYESATWTRCSAMVTMLDPGAVAGVVFGADVVDSTILDGFRVSGGGSAGPDFGAGITVDGASGGRVTNVEVGAGSGTLVAGVNVVNGAAFELDSVRISANTGSSDTVGVRVVGASVTIAGGSVRASGPSVVDAVRLEDAPDSSLSGVGVTAATEFANPATSHSTATAVHVLGDASGIELIDNDVEATGPYYDLVGIRIDDCSGAPLVSGNVVQASNPTNGFVAGQPPTAGITVTGACQAELRANSVVSAGGLDISNVGIACVGPCTVAENSAVCDKTGQIPGGTQGNATALVCNGCNEVTDNELVGLGVPTGIHRSTFYTSTGLVVTGSTLVARNRIAAGCSGAATGVRAANARLENNFIVGRWPDGSCGGFNPTLSASSVGLLMVGGGDIHSNQILGGFASSGVPLSAALDVVSGTPSIRNNVIGAFPEAIRGTPTLLENNALTGTVAGSLTTASQVNALPGADANFFASCGYPLTAGSPCIDTGTATGAPAYDFSGTPRDATPDVGPDEYDAPNPCAGEDCSAHGTCTETQGLASCTCAPGYRNPSGQPLVCEVDACFGGNGGCDPLTVCTPVDGGTRSCSPCPPGYLGDGESGCTVDATPFVQLSAGNAHTCGVRATGALRCWGWSPFYYGNSPPDGQTFLEVSAGSEHSIALRSDGTLAFWGNDQEGLGSVPSGTFKTARAGYLHDCAIRTDDTLACWGWNGSGQTDARPGPVAAVDVGETNTCVLLLDGTISCFGSNEFGESTPPAGVFESFDLHGSIGCGVRPGGSVECWGRPDLAGWEPPPPFAFQEVQGTGNGFAVCGLRTDDLLACWGYDGGVGLIPPPSQEFASYSMGQAHACGILLDDAVLCWGLDQYGEGTPP